MTRCHERRLLPPLDHPDAARWLITGTGLSHLGSAAARDSMHVKLKQDEAQLTDSMKMFKWGMEGGKPAAGEIGVQPEWFYKGDGSCVVAPEQALELPAYALDGGEEVEVVGCYVIGDNGEPLRVGFALGNEYADHVMERQNYLYLAHSKLRQCSYGPELLLGELPASVRAARLLRDGKAIWSDTGCRARTTWRTPLPTSSTITSSIATSADRETCTCISSARRPAASPRTSRPRSATCSRSLSGVRPAAAQSARRAARSLRVCRRAGAVRLPGPTAHCEDTKAPRKAEELPS